MEFQNLFYHFQLLVSTTVENTNTTMDVEKRHQLAEVTTEELQDTLNRKVIELERRVKKIENGK